MHKLKKVGILLLCLSMLTAFMMGCQGNVGDTEIREESVVGQPNGSTSSPNGGNQELYTLYEDMALKLYDAGNGMVSFTIQEKGYLVGGFYYGYADLQGNVVIEPKNQPLDDVPPAFAYDCIKVCQPPEGKIVSGAMYLKILDKEGKVLFEQGDENRISGIGGVSEGYFWVETFDEDLSGKTYTVTYYSAKDLKAVATFEDTRAFPEENYTVDNSLLKNGRAYLVKGKSLPYSPTESDNTFTFKMSDYDETYASAENQNWMLDLNTVAAFDAARYKELIAVGTDKGGKMLGTVCLTNSSSTKYYAIVDSTGTVLLDAQTKIVFDENISVFKNGLCAAMDAESECWGYINAQGQWVIQPQFASARPFGADGYAVVNDMVVIDEGGKVILAPSGYSIESVNTLEGKYDYDYGDWTVYLTFSGNEVSYYQASSYWTTSWSGTYVIKGGKIIFEGNPTYGDILCCGQTYSFKKNGDVIYINEKRATLVEEE